MRQCYPPYARTESYRFTYAAATATRILSGYKMLSLRKNRMTPEQYDKRLSDHHRRSAERIFKGVVSLRGLMIKIGQTIGSRPDVFPEEYASILSRLQDQVPPHPWKEMKPHLERELGGPIESFFSEFDPKPVAAASLAQVYKAKLKDGRQVAVKVVYPNSPRLVRPTFASSAASSGLSPASATTPSSLSTRSLPPTCRSKST